MMMTLPLLCLLGACAGRESRSRDAVARLRSTDVAAEGHEPGSEMRGIAVVELFTSEGCSSCPPADRLLGQIDERARAEGSRVFPLAFHVDYWNSLGWIDPFSDAAYSNRQREYARALHLESIYTPEMIVNGRREFVGSSRENAEEALSEALSRPEENTIALHLGTGREYGDILVEYDVTGEHRGRVLNIALVESDLTVKVPRGENSGRTLHHDNVVRQFTIVRIDSAERGDLSIPVVESAQRKKLLVIAYVQDTLSMNVTGAVAAAPPPL
jgi:hypothetical protein